MKLSAFVLGLIGVFLRELFDFQRYRTDRYRLTLGVVDISAVASGPHWKDRRKRLKADLRTSLKDNAAQNELRHIAWISALFIDLNEVWRLDIRLLMSVGRVENSCQFRETVKSKAPLDYIWDRLTIKAYFISLKKEPCLTNLSKIQRWYLQHNLTTTSVIHISPLISKRCNNKAWINAYPFFAGYSAFTTGLSITTVTVPWYSSPRGLNPSSLWL